VKIKTTVILRPNQLYGIGYQVKGEITKNTPTEGRPLALT